MYCKYCGRKIQEGEICNCRSQNDSVRESGSQKNKQESEQPKKQKERPKKEKQSQSKKNGSWNKTPLHFAIGIRSDCSSSSGLWDVRERKMDCNSNDCCKCAGNCRDHGIYDFSSI